MHQFTKQYDDTTLVSIRGAQRTQSRLEGIPQNVLPSLRIKKKQAAVSQLPIANEVLHTADFAANVFIGVEQNKVTDLVSREHNAIVNVTPTDDDANVPLEKRTASDGLVAEVNFVTIGIAIEDQRRGELVGNAHSACNQDERLDRRQLVHGRDQC